MLMPMNFPPSLSSIPDNTVLNLRRQLRREALQKRKQLSYFQQKKAAAALCRQVRKLAVYQRARTVALYLSSGAEIGTQNLLQMAWRDHKRCYVPVLHPWHTHHMVFVPYRQGQRVFRNRWGILEPALGTNSIRARDLDLVLMPLVAFDSQGRRLGMGKGFYDRALEFRLHTRCKPVLAGLAHDQHKIDGDLPVTDWDVDLDMVITPSRVYCFR